MPPPFRADHLGSFISPASLQEARQHAATKPSPTSQQHLHQCQQDAIKDIVQQQLDHHVRPITSGGFEHPSPLYGFLEKLQGFQITEIPISEYRPNHPHIRHLKSQGQTSTPAIICTGKIAHVTSPLLPQWLYLRSLVAESQWRELKMSIVSPTYFQSLLPGKAYTKDSGYERDEAFFADVIAAYRTEIKVLHEHGLRLLQIDDPGLATLFREEGWVAAQTQSSEQKPANMLNQYIRVHNAVLDGLPTDLTVGLHLCRGSMAPGHNDTYAPIAEQIFNSLDYQLYYLDFSASTTNSTNTTTNEDNTTPRTNGSSHPQSEVQSQPQSPFKSLSHFPLNKSVILGLISSTTSTHPIQRHHQAIRPRRRRGHRAGSRPESE